MIFILDHAPLAAEAQCLISSGCTKLLFPFATEGMVALYAERLAEARDLLVAAGVEFGVSSKVVAW
jgi:hypothetical protein